MRHLKVHTVRAANNQAVQQGTVQQGTREELLSSKLEIGPDVPLAQKEVVSAGNNGSHLDSFPIPTSEKFDSPDFWSTRRKNSSCAL